MSLGRNTVQKSEIYISRHATRIDIKHVLGSKIIDRVRSHSVPRYFTKDHHYAVRERAELAKLDVYVFHIDFQR